MFLTYENYNNKIDCLQECGDMRIHKCLEQVKINTAFLKAIQQYIQSEKCSTF